MRAFPGALALGAAVALPTPAAAQDPSIEVANRAVERACQDFEGRTIDADRISRFIMLERDARLPDNRDLPVPQVAERERDRALLLLATTSYLQEQLAVPGSDLAKALAVSPAPPARGPTGRVDWLFAGSGGYTLTCAVADPVRPRTFPSISRVVVRGSVDELDAVGDDRLTAAAARVGYDRLRTTNLEAETTRTTTVTLDAAVALAAGNVDRYGMIYADYSLSRVRKRTSPEETAEEDDGRADDVDALEIGVLGTIRPVRWLRTTGRIGVTIDSITDSRYIHGGLTLAPITMGLPNLGLCNLNSFRRIGLGIEGKCTLAAEVDVRYVLQNGSAELDESDTLLGIGGVVGAEFRRALDLSGSPRDGLVASLSYRYLPLVDGRGPDIDRVDASLGYRWWAGDLGFELGLTYADGTERKSLADENRFGITFGLIY